MNRDIKFKFWLGHTKKMTYEHSLIDIAHSFWDFTEDIIPLQYTGLKDKNGKEIYEGDILKISKGNPRWIKDGFEVVFNYGSFCLSPIGYDFVIQGGSPTSLLLYADNCEENGLSRDIEKYIEVIGNIYENEELLK